MKNIKILFQVSFAGIFLYACNNGNVGKEYGYGYHQWDLDEDEVVTTTEYNEAWQDVGYYDEWDTDGSGNIDREEWNDAMEKYYPDWDETKSDKMVFDEWDVNNDEALDDEELANASFNVWDINGDGEIDVVEYEEWAWSKER